MTLIPTIYNADTLGIRPDLISRPIESWAELLNPEFKGKASILDIPSIGIMDAAMVSEAIGRHQVRRQGQHDQGGDRQDDRASIEAKQAGQFRALLEDLQRERQPDGLGRGRHPVDVVAGDHRGAPQGIPCVYQPLKEGYRAWGAGLGLPKHARPAGRSTPPTSSSTGTSSGWVGGFLMRQGYYSAVPETSKEFMSENEWGYWIEGKPATEPIRRPTGDGWPSPARSATAARSTSAWARSPAGTR